MNTYFWSGGPLKYLRLTKYNVEQTFIQKPLPVVVKAHIEISKRYQYCRTTAIPPSQCNAIWHVNVEENKGLNVFLTKQEIAGQHELYRAIIGKKFNNANNRKYNCLCHFTRVSMLMRSFQHFIFHVKCFANVIQVSLNNILFAEVRII